MGIALKPEKLTTDGHEDQEVLKGKLALKYRDVGTSLRLISGRRTNLLYGLVFMPLSLIDDRV